MNRSLRAMTCFFALLLSMTPVLSACGDSTEPSEPPDPGARTDAPPAESATEAPTDPATEAPTDPATEAPTDPPRVALTFSPDVDGAAPLTVQVAEDAATVVLPEDPTREGYAFKGWYTEPEGKGARVTASFPLAGEATYHALWAPRVDMTKRNRIKIGGFNGITEANAVESDFAALSDCGVDEIYMTFFHDDSDDGKWTLEKSLQYVRWMEQYGIKAWINDFKLNDLLSRRAPRAEIEALLSVYRDSPAFIGNYLVDEPAGGRFDELIRAIEYYQEIMPGYEMYVNLLSNEAPTPCFINDSFKEYVTAFAERFPLSYVSQDFYPIEVKNNKKKVLSDKYYISLYDAACAAREANKENWMYVYTMRDTVNAIKDYEPSLSDVRLEAFNAMAFGCCSLTYFCFDCPPSYSKSASFGMLKDHVRTSLFDVGKQLTAEIKALSDCFPRYLWRDTFFVGQSRPFRRNAGRALQAFAGGNGMAAAAVTSDRDLIVGYFEEANGDGEAYMLVNNSAPSNYQPAQVTATLPDALGVTAHIGLETRTLEPSDGGVYSITLLPGQGCFLEVNR